MRKLMTSSLSCLAALGLQAATYYPITIDYEPEAPIADFPVLVHIPANSPIYEVAGTGGEALRFTNDLGTKDYPHEVDTWNTSGESLVWVKIPELKKDAAFRLYCSGEDTTVAKDVWSDYAGVWHLNEPLDSAEKDLKPEDGTTHTTKFYTEEATARAVSDAVIGKGLGSTAGKGAAFSSQVYDDRNGYKCPIQVSNPSKFTVSCWVRVQSVAGWTLLFGPVNANTGNNGWKAEWTAADGKAMRLCQFGGAGSQLNYFTTPDLATGWHKLDSIWDNNSLILYIDGTFFGQKTDCPGVPTWNWSGWMGWGGCIDGKGALAGAASGTDFDECRIYDGVKNAGRIAADYATVKDEAFLTIGPATEEQDIPAGTVAQVGSDYYQVFEEAVAASRASGNFIILMANGQSWTFDEEGEKLDIKLSGMSFETINALGEDYYIDEVRDSSTDVTTFTLKKQVKVAAMRNVAAYKQLYTRDLAAILPAQVAGLAADGSVVGMFDVVWDVEDITKYDFAGVTQVPGLATVGAEQWPVTAFVRATLDYSDDYHNIAQEADSMVVTAPAIGEWPFIDDPKSISDSPMSMVTNGLVATAKVGAWANGNGSVSNWKSGTKNPYLDVAFGWGEAKRICRIEVIARTTSNVQLKGIVITADGEEVTSTMPTPNPKGSEFVNGMYNHRYDFGAPIEAQSLNITMEQGLSAGASTHLDLEEILVWSEGTPKDKNEISTSAELVKLELDGVPVELKPGVTSYLVPRAKEVTLAEGEANVGVTVMPTTTDGVIRIITTSEDGLSSMTYKIRTKSGFSVLIR